MTTPAAEVAVDIVILLKRGRVGPALMQLERLPDLIRDEVEQAGTAGYERGQLDLAREITDTAAKPKRQQRLSNAEWLHTRIADPPLRERVKATLRMGDDLLNRVLDGTAELSPTQMRKLRKELGS